MKIWSKKNLEEISRGDLPAPVDHLIDLEEADKLPTYKGFYNGKILRLTSEKKSVPPISYIFQGQMEFYRFFRCEPTVLDHVFQIDRTIEFGENVLIKNSRDLMPFVNTRNVYKEANKDSIDINQLNIKIQLACDEHRWWGGERVPRYWRDGDKPPIKQVVKCFFCDQYLIDETPLFFRIYFKLTGRLYPDFKEYCGPHRSMFIEAEIERPLILDSNTSYYSPVSGNIREGEYSGKRNYKNLLLLFSLGENNKPDSLIRMGILED